MKAMLDAAGRIVIPKPLRQALGLRAGQALEIRAGDGRLEIEIAPTPMQLKKRGKGLIAVPKDVFGGLFKSVVFGVIIAIIGCSAGLRARGGALGVGRATRQAVLVSIVAIIVSNYFMTWFMYQG